MAPNTARPDAHRDYETWDEDSRDDTDGLLRDLPPGGDQIVRLPRDEKPRLLASRPWPYDGPEGRARLTGSLGD